MKRLINEYDWDKKIRVKYSLFSFSWVVMLFIMMGVSILYTLTVYQRLTAYLETTENETMKFVLGLGAFLFLCLLFCLCLLPAFLIQPHFYLIQRQCKFTHLLK